MLLALVSVALACPPGQFGAPAQAHLPEDAEAAVWLEGFSRPIDVDGMVRW